jgi:hypothetical protein
MCDISAGVDAAFSLTRMILESRAMGERDLYPFVIAPPVVHKLGFMHDLVQGRV